jgi:fermentation-respiration switch protein FrsA (DUF1100 family)
MRDSSLFSQLQACSMATRRSTGVDATAIERKDEERVKLAWVIRSSAFAVQNAGFAVGIRFMKFSRRRYSLVVLALLVVLASASYLAAGMYVAHRYKTDSRRHGYDVTPEDYQLDSQDVRFRSEDGVPLVGWFIPSAQPGGPNSDAGVVIVHGHYGNMGRSWRVVREDGTVVQSNEFEKGCLALHRAGFNLLLFDLRNHGRSGAAPPVSLGLYESRDVLAAVRWLAERPEINPNRVGVKGSSMGGASALLAAERDAEQAGLIQALWIDSTFSTARSAIGDVLEYQHIGLLQWSTLLWARALTRIDVAQVQPVRAIADLRIPIQLVHSIDDTMLDYHQSIELFEAGEPGCCELWITRGFSHNLSWQHEDYQRRLVQFFEQHLEDRGKAGEEEVEVSFFRGCSIVMQ